MNKHAEHFLNNKLVPIVTLPIIFLFYIYILGGKREHDQAVMDACIEMYVDEIKNGDELYKYCIDLATP